MKAFIVTLIIFILMVPFSPFSTAQIYNQDYSNTQKFNLFKSNKVWMVYGWTFLYPKGKQEKKGTKTSFERFDREGNLTDENYYDRNGNIMYTCEHQYDEKGNEIKKMGAQGDEVIYEKWNYTSVENDKVERKSEYKKSKGEKWISTFDVQKNIKEIAYYDVSSNITARWEFQYDAKQNVVEKREYDGYGNIYQKWTYKYDEKGNNTEIYHYISNNQLDRIYQMRYDKKGNMKSKFTFDKDEKVIDLTVYVYQFYDGLHATRGVGNKE